MSSHAPDPPEAKKYPCDCSKCLHTHGGPRMLSRSTRSQHRAADRAAGTGPAPAPESIGSFGAFLNEMYQEALVPAGIPNPMPEFQAAPPAGPSDTHEYLPPQRKRQRQDVSRNNTEDVKLEYNEPVARPGSTGPPEDLKLAEPQPSEHEDELDIEGDKVNNADEGGEDQVHVTVEEDTSPLFGNEGNDNEVDMDVFSDDDIFVCATNCTMTSMLYVQTKMISGSRRRRRTVRKYSALVSRKQPELYSRT